MRSVKIMIMLNGTAQVTMSRAKRGYAAGRNAIIEIVDVPDDEQDGNVLAAYSRCVVMPVMHAETPIPWRLIANSTPGKIVRLTRGRPEKEPEARLSERVSIKLDPELADRWARTTPGDIRDILRKHLPELPE